MNTHTHTYTIPNAGFQMSATPYAECMETHTHTYTTPNAEFEMSSTPYAEFQKLYA